MERGGGRIEDVGGHQPPTVAYSYGMCGRPDEDITRGGKNNSKSAYTNLCFTLDEEGADGRILTDNKDTCIPAASRWHHDGGMQNARIYYNYTASEQYQASTKSWGCVANYNDNSYSGNLKDAECGEEEDTKLPVEIISKQKLSDDAEDCSVNDCSADKSSADECSADNSCGDESSVVKSSHDNDISTEDCPDTDCLAEKVKIDNCLETSSIASTAEEETCTQDICNPEDNISEVHCDIVEHQIDILPPELFLDIIQPHDVVAEEEEVEVRPPQCEDELPTYRSLIAFRLEDCPPSYESVTGIPINVNEVGCAPRKERLKDPEFSDARKNIDFEFSSLGLFSSRIRNNELMSLSVARLSFVFI